MRPDERSFLLSMVSCMPVYVAVPFILPRMFSLTDIPQGVGWRRQRGGVRHDGLAQCCVPDELGRVYLPPCIRLSVVSVVLCALAHAAQFARTARAACVMWRAQESLQSEGLYLLDDGRFLCMWISDGAQP